MKSYFLALSLLIFCSINLLSQKWTNYRSIDYSFHSVTIDHKDNIWLSEGMGLLKFDGKSWIIYDSIFKSTLSCAVADSNGIIWAGTEYGTVFKYDGKKLIRFTATDGLIPDCFVSVIKIDKYGNKWVGTDKGLMKYDNTHWTCYYKSDGLVSSNIQAIEIDKNGNKWFGTDNGISKYNDTLWKSYTPIYNSTPDIINDVKQDKQGFMWFASSSGGVLKLNGSFTRYTTANGLASNYTRKLAVDSTNSIWIGTSSSGISKFDGNLWTTYNTSKGLPNNSIYNLEIDSKGTIWLNCSIGLYKFNGGTKWNLCKFFISNTVQVAEADKEGNVWFGTDQGVIKFDGISWTFFTTLNGLANNNVKAVLIDNKNNKWFGTAGGVSKFDGTNWVTYNTANGLAKNDVRAIAADAKGDYWFGTLGGGVSRFDDTTWTTYNKSNSGLKWDNVYSIEIDADDKKWIGNESGISVLKDGIWDNFNSTRVTTVKSDRQGRKWRGLYSGGAAFHNGIIWKSYFAGAGLAGDNVYSMMVDDQNVKWIGTNNGVSKYDGYSWTTLREVNGLAGNIVNSICIDQNGNKWFATNKGISKYVEEKSTINLNASPLILNIDGNEGSTVSFVISSNTSWSVSSDQSWLTVLNAEGSNNDTVCLKAIANPFAGSRLANIYISGAGYAQVEIPVIQKTATKSLTVSDPFVYLDSLENNLTSFIISANTKWEITCEEPWLTIHKISGTNNDTIRISASANSNNDSRYAALTIKGDSVPSVNVMVVQSGLLTDKWSSYVQSVASPDLGKISCIALSDTTNYNYVKWIGTNRGLWKYNNTKWVHYTSSNGLINDTINSIYVNSYPREFWIGTNSGLSIYNGSSWKSFTTENGLVNNSIHTITYNAKDTSFWIGTDNGIATYKKNIWDTISVKNGLPDSSITCLFYRYPKEVWIGTKNGLSVYNCDLKTYTNYTTVNGLPHNYIYTIRQDSYNNIWIGTKGGLLKISGVTWTIFTENDKLTNNEVHTVAFSSQNFIAGTSKGLSFFHNYISSNRLDTTNGLSDNYVSDICFEPNYDYWIGTAKGLFKLRSEDQPTKYTDKNELINNKVNGIVVDHTGKRWFATNGGVSMFNGTDWIRYTTADGLPDNGTSCITVDQNNVIWVGTYYNGISKFDGTAWTNYNKNNSPIADNNISLLVVDRNNNLWIGTAYMGISKFDGTTWRKYTNSSTMGGLYSNNIDDLAIDQKNNLWVADGTGFVKGLCKYDGDKWTQITFNDGSFVTQAECLNFDSFGNLWCITNKGLAKYDGYFWTFYLTFDFANKITRMKFDNHNILWMGGPAPGGVFSYDGKNLKNYGSNFYSRAIQSIYIDILNNKWFGTQSCGVTFTQNKGLYVSEKKIILKAVQDKTTQFYIASNTSWTINTDQPWLKVNKFKGTNYEILTLNVSDNLCNCARDGQLTISGNGVNNQFITVEQLANNDTIYQASNVRFDSLGSNKVNVNWHRGNGQKCVAFAKKGNGSLILPSDYVSYEPDAIFGNGTQIDTSGWYCVYKGTANNFTVSDLDPNTRYQFIVYEYFEMPGGEKYMNCATSNLNCFKTLKATPAIIWNTPSDIVYGTLLSGKQLNAITFIPGIFEYMPGAGTLMDAGSEIVLTVHFVPDDTSMFNSVNLSVTINVLQLPDKLEPAGEQRIRIYPTVVRENLYIETADNADRAFITDIYGKKVYETRIGIDKPTTLNLSNLKSGVYLLLLYTKNNTLIQCNKIVKTD